MTIDGTTQAGVVIDGDALTQDGLVLAAGSGGSTIEGLTIRNFAGAGIRVQSSGDHIQGDVLGASGLGNQVGVLIDGGSNNVVGGATSTLANMIVANSVAGVEISGGGATANVVQGNFIGTDAAGANLNNQIGVVIDQGAGTNSLNSNTIGFNVVAGVQITGAAGTGNVLTRNYIGTNSTGGTLGNGTGVEVASAGNFIGQLGAGNTIGGNTGAGVSIVGASATGNQVVGNLIGTNAAGANLHNATGVYIASSGNMVGGTASGAGNTIAHNSLAAVTVDSGAGNAIRENIVFANGQGIVLNSANNANNNQPFPLLTSVTISTGFVTLKGTLSLPPFQASSTYSLDFFASAPGDSLIQGQAHIYLGSAAVTTAGSGATTFSETFPLSSTLGPLFTSTATSPGDDTSAFAPGLYLVTNTADIGTGSLREAITYASARRYPSRLLFRSQVPVPSLSSRRPLYRRSPIRFRSMERRRMDSTPSIPSHSSRSTGVASRPPVTV